MFKILNGRGSFWQWDSGQKLSVADSTCAEVHYSNGTGETAIVCEVRNGVADVPNILLQSSNPVRVYGYIRNGDDRYTKIEAVFRVLPRERPSSYIYEETETLSYSSLAERIAELEENGGGGGDVNIRLGHALYYDGDGRLSVDVANDAEEDNTLPISSAAVGSIVGNIEVLLRTI